jgi:hypothetical protein
MTTNKSQIITIAVVCANGCKPVIMTTITEMQWWRRLSGIVQQDQMARPAIKLFFIVLLGQPKDDFNADSFCNGQQNTNPFFQSRLLALNAGIQQML